MRVRFIQQAVLAALCLAPVPAWSAPTLIPEVISVRPHDSSAFTQGLLLHQGSLYESTGVRGASTVREVNPLTGAVLRSVDLPASDFGEGLARVGSQLVQLTCRRMSPTSTPSTHSPSSTSTHTPGKAGASATTVSA